MYSRPRRTGALLLAMFYFAFAGGIEFLHHHADGVLPGWGFAGSSIERAASPHPPGLGKRSATAPKAPPSECAACQWAQNGQATTPSVAFPVFVSPVLAAFATPTRAFDSIPTPPSSSRGPPLV